MMTEVYLSAILKLSCLYMTIFDHNLNFALHDVDCITSKSKTVEKKYLLDFRFLISKIKRME